jgi:hypothetical protein
MHDDLRKVLSNDWPHARDAESELQRLRIPGSRACSRRFNNEVRDALDHLYRIAVATDHNKEQANVNSIAEHLRRAAVETLEFHIEQQLSKLRPSHLRWALESLRDREFGILGEVLAKSLYVRRRYTELALLELFRGQQFLAEARQTKGSEMETTRAKLEEAHDAFKRASAEITGGGVRSRLFQLLLAAAMCAVGLGAPRLIHLFGGS